MMIRDIPGYIEALREDQFKRDVCWLKQTHSVAGFEVREMTFRDYLMLRCLGNAFFVSGNLTSVSIIGFLWTLSPEYPDWKAKRRLVKRCLKFIPPPRPKLKWFLLRRRWERQSGECLNRANEVIAEIQSYLSEIFMDWPTSEKTENWNAPYWGEGADTCAAFARAYRLSFEDTLNLPMRGVLQCMRELKFVSNRGKADASFSNPSDRVINQFMLSRRN